MTGGSLPWLALILLGAGHGVNPAMGWLFAVARGLQEPGEGRLWRTLPPLALGHGVAIGAALTLAMVAGVAIPARYLRWCVAALLAATGLWGLLGRPHRVRGGMRIGGRDLAVWSFLMASAHGAGLMVVPLLLGADPAMPHDHGVATEILEAAVAGPASHAALRIGGAALVHTLGYLALTAAIAIVVFRRLGLRLLRTAWINLDLVWSCALLIAAVLTPIL